MFYDACRTTAICITYWNMHSPGPWIILLAGQGFVLPMDQNASEHQEGQTGRCFEVHF